jgi:hypothetical protein
MSRPLIALAGLLATALCLLALSAGPARAAGADGSGFSLEDKAGDHLDVLLDGKVTARYMYAHDTSTKDRRTETYKPYLHVFDAEGKAPITQGAGGKLYPHHRGIYIGWQKLGFEGKTYNLWEMAGGDIVHKAFTNQKAGPDEATFTSQTEWVLNDGRKILAEDRTMTFRRGPAPFRLLIDFTSKLAAPAGDVKLAGDPEHGGIQFRPAGDIIAADTVYYLPKENADPHKDTEYPWAGETFTLPGGQYSVVEMSHPDNPKGTRWSTYRDYGRFGAYPTALLKSGDTITLKYRFLIADGKMPPADVIEKSYDQFSGAKEPSPTPKVTERPAEGAKSPAPKTPKPAKPAAGTKETTKEPKAP